MPEIIAQREFLPAYMLFDTIFLLGGIRSAAITAWDDKLITLLVNSLLETNLWNALRLCAIPAVFLPFYGTIKKAP